MCINLVTTFFCGHISTTKVSTGPACPDCAEKPQSIHVPVDPALELLLCMDCFVGDNTWGNIQALSAAAVVSVCTDIDDKGAEVWRLDHDEFVAMGAFE
jgi:hypothetical protein